MSTEPFIYESAEAKHDDDFWLEQGQKLIVESLPSVRQAAKGLMTALGLVKGIYLAILGFSGYLTEETTLYPIRMAGYFVPLFLWLGSIYACMAVMMTKKWLVLKDSPESVRSVMKNVLKGKQKSLLTAFWLFAAGLIWALGMFVWRVS